MVAVRMLFDQPGDAVMQPPPRGLQPRPGPIRLPARRHLRKAWRFTDVALRRRIGSWGTYAYAAIRGHRHLMWPIPIHHGFAEFAFTIDHRRLRGGRRPRSTLLAANGGRARSRSGGRRQGSTSTRTKREQQFRLAV